jgi:hypothetical protein
MQLLEHPKTKKDTLIENTKKQQEMPLFVFCVIEIKVN